MMDIVIRCINHADSCHRQYVYPHVGLSVTLQGLQNEHSLRWSCERSRVTGCQASAGNIYVISLGCLCYITVFNLIVKQISWNEVELTSLFNCRIFLILDFQRSFDRTMRGCPWWNINFHNSGEFRGLRTKYKSIQIKRHTNVITKIDPNRVKVNRRATHLYLCLTKGGGKWHWKKKKNHFLREHREWSHKRGLQHQAWSELSDCQRSAPLHFIQPSRPANVSLSIAGDEGRKDCLCEAQKAPLRPRLQQ